MTSTWVIKIFSYESQSHIANDCSVLHFSVLSFATENAIGNFLGGKPWLLITMNTSSVSCHGSINNSLYQTAVNWNNYLISMHYCIPYLMKNCKLMQFPSVWKKKNNHICLWCSLFCFLHAEILSLISSNLILLSKTYKT